MAISGGHDPPTYSLVFGSQGIEPCIAYLRNPRLLLYPIELRDRLFNKTFIYWFYALVKVFFKAPSENRTRISWMEARNNNHYTTGAYNLFIPQKPSTVNCKIHSQFRKTLEKF